MRSHFLLIGIVLLLLFASCGGSTKVMDTGFLQKRKHLPGWDLSFGERGGSHDLAKRDLKDPAPIKDLPKIEGPSIYVDDVDQLNEQITASHAPVEDHVGRSTAGSLENGPRVLIDFVSPVKEQEEVNVPQQDLMPKKKWNKFAVPAFAAALGVVYLGLFSTSTIAVIVAIGITFILSGISLRQIRSRDEAGKGFALIALIIALLASIATAMVTYVVGFI